MMVAEKASSLPRVFGNGLSWLLTTYSAYKFLNNRSIGNGISVSEGIAGLLYWEVGFGLTYLHTSLDYQNVIIQNQLQIINAVNDNKLSDWEKIGILNSTPSNLCGPCP